MQDKKENANFGHHFNIIIMKNLLLLYVVMLFVGLGQPCHHSILYQLTSDSIKYWEDSCSGYGIAFLKEGNLFHEYEKGRYSLKGRHSRNQHFIISGNIIELYDNSKLYGQYRMILLNDSIIGLYNATNNILYKKAQDQKKAIDVSPMFRAGYKQSSIIDTSLQLFYHNLDSLFNTYHLTISKASLVLNSQKVVLEIDENGNVYDCGFIINHRFCDSLNLNDFEKEILRLCYQIKCMPARDTIENETIKSKIGLNILREYEDD